MITVTEVSRVYTQHYLSDRGVSASQMVVYTERVGISVPSDAPPLVGDNSRDNSVTVDMLVLGHICHSFSVPSDAPPPLVGDNSQPLRTNQPSVVVVHIFFVRGDTSAVPATQSQPHFI